MSLLRNSVEDLCVHVSELKQQADRDRAALARAHKDKVTHTHCTRTRSHCTRMLSVLHVFTVLLVLCRLWNCMCSLYSLYSAGCGTEAAEDRVADR